MSQPAFDALIDELADRVWERIEPRIAELIAEHLPPNPTSPAVLSALEAARYCCISLQHLYNLTSRGEGPPHTKHGRRNVYVISDLDDWLHSRLVRK